MKKFEDWQNSGISLMGDPKEKRGTVTKALLMGLVGLMTVKAGIAPIVGELSQSNVQGDVEHSRLANSLSDISQKINAEYGSEHTVIVLHDDPGLKFVLENAQADLFKRNSFNTDTLTGKVRTTVAEFAQDKLGLDVNMDMVKRNNIYDSFQNDDSPQVRLFGDVASEKAYDSIALVRGWGGPDFMSSELSFPIHYDYAAQNSFTFFHELTHAVDTRDGRPDAEIEYHDVYLHSEAIADMGASLLFYKKTGNLDEWNYNIKPYRMAHDKDIYHSTNEIVTGALKNVDFDKVKTMSDKEVLLYAKDTINTRIKDMLEPNRVNKLGWQHSEWEQMRRTEAYYVGKAVVSSGYYHSSGRWLGRIDGLDKDELMRERGRSVMEASLNNLVYNGKLEQHGKKFESAVAEHIVRFDDRKAEDAYVHSFKGDDFDAMGFAQKMGFKIDKDAALRKDSNQEILAKFFTEKTGQSPLVGFELQSFQQNVQSTVVARYAEKALDKAVEFSSHFKMGIP